MYFRFRSELLHLSWSRQSLEDLMLLKRDIFGSRLDEPRESLLCLSVIMPSINHVKGSVTLFDSGSISCTVTLLKAFAKQMLSVPRLTSSE